MCSYLLSVLVEFQGACFRGFCGSLFLCSFESSYLGALALQRFLFLVLGVIPWFLILYSSFVRPCVGIVLLV